MILGEPPDQLREVAALRLLRLSKLSVEGQTRVRGQEDELLYHLPPERFDLPEESAVMVSALVRVHVEAIADGASLGVLDGEDRVSSASGSFATTGSTPAASSSASFLSS